MRSEPAFDTDSLPLLAMRGISKSFPGVRALDDVTLELRSGEVLAFLGENGAGKSTLIKTLGGAHRPDTGRILIDGNEIEIGSPAESQKHGIAIIYQEFNLIPGLSVRENIFLGREIARGGWISRREEQAKTRALLDRIGISIPTETPVNRLSVAQQQIVEIAKALSQNARILVMDEPSATLTPPEVEALFRIIRDLKKDGIGIVYVSHRLEEIFEISDRILVLRDGATVGQSETDSITRTGLIEMMVGRELQDEFPRRTPDIGEPVLEVRKLNAGERVRDVSFDLRKGEILALTGLVGAGRTETARLLFGADRMESGEISLHGKRQSIRSPRDAIAAGICLLTEDRKNQGLVLNHSVLHNFGLPNLDEFSRSGFVRQREEARRFDHYVKRFRIKIPSPRQLARNLSGGNQQKVVLAKWLQADTNVIIFDEPTRGIDVGAKYEIYVLMNELAAMGKCILMISSELPEVLGMSDRILVMHEGRITGEIEDVAGCSQEQIMELAVQ